MHGAVCLYDIDVCAVYVLLHAVCFCYLVNLPQCGQQAVTFQRTIRVPTMFSGAYIDSVKHIYIQKLKY